MPVSGAYRVSFSLFSDTGNGEENIAYIYINGDRMLETRHYTYSGLHTKYSSSGREWFLEARSGDTISLGIWRSEGYWGRIIFCIELMSSETNGQTDHGGVIPKSLVGQGEDLKDLNSEQEEERPRGNDPNDTEEESSDLVTLTDEDVPNESKNHPRKKSKPKAKKLKPKTGRETTNTITNYFGAD